MKNIILWNDFVLKDGYPKTTDDELRERLNRKFGECSCQYLGLSETMLWIKKHQQTKGIAIGSRPSKIFNNLPALNIHRIFDTNRCVCDYKIEEQSEETAKALSINKIALFEDCIVQGNTVRKILSIIPNSTEKQIKIIAMMGIKSNILELQLEYPFLEFEVEYLIDGLTSGNWECTVLFLSDLLDCEKMFIEDERRMKQCFYEDYEEIKAYFLKNKVKISFE